MSPDIAELRQSRHRKYLARGIAFAIASGVCYGLYTGFLTLAQTQGVWGSWFAGAEWGDGHAALSSFTIAFALAALAAGLNDLFSGVWSLAVCAKRHQVGDFAKTLGTKPGRIMVICAVLGGPVATIAYVVGLNSATASGNPGVIVPIAALNCAIGTVLGRILFGQKLEAHKVAGVAICLAAGGIIGGASFAAIGPDALLGCAFAFVAAFGWGFEGCVAGFGTALIDYRIGITIRQLSAGVLELAIAFPALATIGDGLGSVPALLGAAVADPSLLIFVVSGLFAMPAFSFWYKGNSMCGTALGMACNGMYAFWGPFFIWLIMGALNIGGMADSYPPLTATQWLGALIMVAGIFCIAVNPTEALRRKTAVRAIDAADWQENGVGRATSLHESRETFGHAEESGSPETNAAGCALENSAMDAAHQAPIGTTAPQTPVDNGDREPLYYAIVRQFLDGKAHCAENVIASLTPAYGAGKLLGKREIEEALATAKENDILEEAGYEQDARGDLRIFYRISDFGKTMAERYL